ncbi:uncharacterized protein LOC130689142 [Daphnia carinata]|uniref:uncharacterized protein LOC130689142 n=1 Tax=Daphnia carinata TaxID=120202 RepID=UPI00257A17B6|nr:uncharacterized protein LOC130689142 [Daphnia carinata]
MTKCKSCNEERCEKRYEKRNLCDDAENCTCTCHEEPKTTFWKATGSVLLGAAAFAGGVVLTVSTGGLGTVGIAAVIGGGVLTGAGATAAIHPIAKQLNGERMTGTDYVKDLAIGGTVGAITGGIGAGGASVTTSIASKVGTESLKQGAVKLGCRTVVGAVSGGTASAIQEGVNATSGDATQFNGMNVLKGALLGAATGGVGHVTGGAAKLVDNGVAKSVTKVVADTAGTAVIDATYQKIVDGKVDGKKLALNAGARAATSAAYEAVSNATYKAHGGKEVLQDKLGDKEILDEVDSADRENAVKAKKFVKQLTAEQIEKQIVLAEEVSSAKQKLQMMQDKQSKIQSKLNDANKQLSEITKNPSFRQDAASADTLKQLQDQKGLLQKESKLLGKKIVQFTKEVLKELPRPQKLGDQKLHALDSEHSRQFAADLPEDSTSGRGAKRVVFDVKVNEDGTVKNVKIAGIIDDHDYTKVPKYGEVKVPELTVVEPFVMPKEDEEEDDKEKKKKQ